MKNIINYVVISTLCLTSLFAQQQTAGELIDPANNGADEFDFTDEHPLATPPQYFILQLEYIQIDQLTLTSLLYGDGILKTVKEHRKTIKNLINEGKATLLETSIVTGENNDISRGESVLQFVYPTEYEPAIMPKPNKDGDIPEGAIAVGPTPTAFEERPVGLITEIEGRIFNSQKGRQVRVELEPEWISYEGNMDWATWKDNFGTANISMPLFYKLSFKTGVTFKHNQYRILGIHSQKNAKGFPSSDKKIIVFARAIIKEAGE